MEDRFFPKGDPFGIEQSDMHIKVVGHHYVPTVFESVEQGAKRLQGFLVAGMVGSESRWGGQVLVFQSLEIQIGFLSEQLRFEKKPTALCCRCASRGRFRCWARSIPAESR